MKTYQRGQTNNNNNNNYSGHGGTGVRETANPAKTTAALKDGSYAGNNDFKELSKQLRLTTEHKKTSI